MWGFLRRSRDRRSHGLVRQRCFLPLSAEEFCVSFFSLGKLGRSSAAPLQVLLLGVNPSAAKAE
jgi:hypothetical protein